MAIVHATGLVVPNRSHFEATRFMELGSQSSDHFWLEQRLADPLLQFIVVYTQMMP